MASKLIRIPHNIPLSVISEAVKKHTLREFFFFDDLEKNVDYVIVKHGSDKDYWTKIISKKAAEHVGKRFKNKALNFFGKDGYEIYALFRNDSMDAVALVQDNQFKGLYGDENKDVEGEQPDMAVSFLKGYLHALRK